MKISSNIMPSVVVNVIKSSCSLSDIHAYITDHLEEWNEQGLDECWDLTEMNFVSITPEAIKDFINKTTELSQQRLGKKAAIIVSNDLGFGMMRMLQILSEPKFKNLLKVFKTKEEALDWLKVYT